MTNAAVAKLTKTAKSIAAYRGTLNAKRGQELVDRYNALRLELFDNDYQAWVDFCAATGSAVSHDGYDLFA